MFPGIFPAFTAVAVFKLGDAHQSYAVASPARAPAAAKNAAPAERRGPNRAKNVARPTFGAKARPETPTLTNETAPRKTGTDDEWTSGRAFDARRARVNRTAPLRWGIFLSDT